MQLFKKPYVFDFPSHLADCEFNYRRLRRLMPGWRLLEQSDIDPPQVEWRYLIGHSLQEVMLKIKVREKAKYTTTVHITIYSRLQNQMPWSTHQHQSRESFLTREVDEGFLVAEGSSKPELIPCSQRRSHSLDVRLYHDATVAEVVSSQGHRHIRPRYQYPNPKMYQRDEKVQLNGFLGELLTLCLNEGRVKQDVIKTTKVI